MHQGLDDPDEKDGNDDEDDGEEEEDPIEVVREKKIKWLRAQLAIAESFETANELEVRRMNESLNQNQEAFSSVQNIIKGKENNESFSSKII